MGRRCNHEGSIRQKRPGLWEGSVCLGGRRHWVSGHSRAEVQARLRDLLNRAEGAIPQPGRITLGQYLERWLEAVRPTLRPSSHAIYGHLIRLHLSRLASVPLKRLSPLHLAGLYAELAPATAVAAARVLHRALADAVRWGLIGQNPASLVKPPRPAPKERRRWTVDEARRFLAGADEGWYGPLWVFLLASGCRLGEALGLTWQDVDWQKGTVRIARSITHIRHQPLEGEPKTAAGRRTVALPPFGLEALKRQRRQQALARLQAGSPPGWERVFTTRNGTIPDPGNLRRDFRRTCLRLGLPAIRIHDLRHLAATLLVAGGADPKTVQRRLGHATLQMTLGLYTHFLAEGDYQAASTLQQLLA
jgi:integrase